VRIYDDHMTVWNEGPLPAAVPLESLMGPHSSVPRNPLIADVCFKAGYIDSWGRGIQKITDACLAAGLPRPKFEEAFDGFLVTLTPRGATRQEAHDGAHDGAHDEAHEALTVVEFRVLQACQTGSRSTPDLLDALGYSSRTGSFKKAMSRLLNLGYISMTIPGSPRSRNQRYRLTEEGRSQLPKES
jgi:ATP-dependent DNA helicase RecG